MWISPPTLGWFFKYLIDWQERRNWLEEILVFLHDDGLLDAIELSLSPQGSLPVVTKPIAKTPQTALCWEVYG